MFLSSWRYSHCNYAAYVATQPNHKYDGSHVQHKSVELFHSLHHIKITVTDAFPSILTLYQALDKLPLVYYASH